MKKTLILLVTILSIASICFANGAIEAVVDKSVELGYSINDSNIEKFEIIAKGDTLHISTVIADLEISFENRSDILVRVESNKRNDSYNLKKGEELKTEFEKKEKDREITIIIPYSFYTDFNISSVTGDVDVKGSDANCLIVETVSGDLDMTNSKAENIHLYMMSGELSTNNVEIQDTLIVETTTGEVNIRNTKADKLKLDYTTNAATVIESDFNEVIVDGVTGRFRGDFSFNTLSIDITTGNIELKVDNIDSYEYQISSMSEIKVGDDKTKGSYLKSNNSGKKVIISATASKIKIY